MLAEVGSVLIGLALAAMLYAVGATWYSVRHRDPHWTESGRRSLYGAAVLLGGALLFLLVAFLGNQFQIAYVAQHSSRALPVYLKASAVWAGQEGSLLLWSFLQVLFAALVAGRTPARFRALVPWASVFLGVIAAFFCAMTLFFSNPFAVSSQVPRDGWGMNPLLRHPGMVFHPPVLYLGYVGLAVPFAFALAGLVVGQVDVWHAAARRWTLAAWLFLGLGIFLGARWAYDVLGWGGYWGWDAVENAGLMPWLTATALLHGIVMQERRKGFRLWNLGLVTLSFALVMFGTFTTRSGLIQSVHAFTRSRLGPYFLVFLGMTLVGTLALLLSRRAELARPTVSQRLFSREGAFFLTVLLLLMITVSILVGTLLPTLTQGRFEAPPAWFDRVVGPQFGALVLLMGLCPLLGRVTLTVRASAKRGLPALAGGILVPLLAALVGFTQTISLIGFAATGLAGGVALGEIGADFVGRIRQNDLPRALNHLGRANRRRSGGYLVHVGIVLMAVGVIGTHAYASEQEVTLSPGEPAQVGGYTLVYEDLRQESAEDHVNTLAAIAVYRGTDFLATLKPRLEYHPIGEQTMAVPALRVGLREDLYLVLFGWSDNGTIGVKVFINPLVNFLWGGGLVFLAGGAVAWWPRASQAGEDARRRQTAWGRLGAAAGLAILIVICVVMWGSAWGAVGAVGRPLPGQPAPEFTVHDLDGNSLALSDLRGRVVVVNFWTTWCPTCAGELLDFQELWQVYQAQDVVFVGIAMQEEEIEVRETASLAGVSFPLALANAHRGPCIRR
ncbi:MAG: cytochrome c-type biogenesis CcmF C-terminal domain-containing protein, partial [Anaerolineae bacterium]